MKYRLHNQVIDNRNPSQTELTQTNSESKIVLEGNFLERMLSKIMINSLKTEEGKAFFSQLIGPENKAIVGNKNGFALGTNDNVKNIFKVSELALGDGNNKAICGQKVDIELIAMNNERHTLSDVLGSKALGPGLSSAVIGMNIGSQREAVIPQKYFGTMFQDFHKVRIKLNSIKANLFIDSKNTKIYDDRIAYAIPLLCGDKVNFKMVITDLSNGKTIHQSSQTSHHIGDNNYPLIFAYSLHGKVPVGKRNIIAQGKAYRALNKNKLLFLEPILDERYYMLELSDLTLAEDN